MGIAYLDGSRLRRSLIAAADWVESGVDRVRKSEALIPRVLQHLERRLTPRPRQLRIGIAHADAADTAATVCEEIQKRFHPRECLVADVTAALGVHVGPGTWAVFYQIEEQGDGPQNNHSSERL